LFTKLKNNELQVYMRPLSYRITGALFHQRKKLMVLKQQVTKHNLFFFFSFSLSPLPPYQFVDEVITNWGPEQGWPYF